MKRTGPTNKMLRYMIRQIYKTGRDNGARAWVYAAKLLDKPTRKRIAVNLSKINRYARDGEMVVVPGKVLGAGLLEKKVTIAALSFSKSALMKIKAAGARAITLQQAIAENPKARNVRIIV